MHGSSNILENWIPLAWEDRFWDVAKMLTPDLEARVDLYYGKLTYNKIFKLLSFCDSFIVGETASFEDLNKHCGVKMA